MLSSNPAERYQQIQSFLDRWSKRPLLKGQSFDELFQIEGIPLWWFYRKFFLSNMLPQQVNTFPELLSGKKINRSRSLQLAGYSFLLRNYIYWSEKRKILTLSKNKNIIRTKNPLNPPQKTILLLSYSNHLSEDGQIFRLENLLQELRPRQDFRSLVLFADPLSRRDYQKIAHLNNVYRYYEPQLERKAQRNAQRIFRRWSSLSPETKRKMFQLESVNLYSYFKPALDLFFSPQFLTITFLYYELFKKVIRTENVQRIVITGAYSLFEKVLIAAANQTKTKIIRLDHGLLSENDYDRHADMLGDYLETVVSPAVKQEMIRLGANPARIKIGGAINYDQLYPHLKPLPDNRTILITTSPFIETNKLTKQNYFETVTAILSQILALPETTVSIKLHPIEKTFSDYRRIVTMKGWQQRVKIYPPNLERKKYYELISNSRVCLNFGSDAVYEAMIMDRPIVTIPLLAEKHTAKLAQYTLTVAPRGPVQATIERALKNERFYQLKRKQLVQRYCGRVDGRSGKRIAQLIISDG